MFTHVSSQRPAEHTQPKTTTDKTTLRVIRRIGGGGVLIELAFVSLGFTWTHFDSLGLTWIHLINPTWTHLVPNGSTWAHLGALGFT